MDGKAPEGRHELRRHQVSPLRGLETISNTISWGSRPRLFDVAAPRLIRATSKLTLRVNIFLAYASG